jgi:hypothetical protein
MCDEYDYGLINFYLRGQLEIVIVLWSILLLLGKHGKQRRRTVEFLIVLNA